jgi:hypothetical protein
MRGWIAFEAGPDGVGEIGSAHENLQYMAIKPLLIIG